MQAALSATNVSPHLVSGLNHTLTEKSLKMLLPTDRALPAEVAAGNAEGVLQTFEEAFEILQLASAGGVRRASSRKANESRTCPLA